MRRKGHDDKCIHEECERKAATRSGYCVMHYKRWKRNGFPERVVTQYPEGATCLYCGASGPLHNWYCNACRQRLSKRGTLERMIAPQGSGCIDALGYRRVTVDGETMLEHRHVMEKLLGRKLLPEEVVHHEDEDKANNNPDNLILFANQSEHMKYHFEKRRRLKLFI